MGLDPTPTTSVGRHIAWRDDITRTCQCGHHKGVHALPAGRCLTLSVPPVNNQPGCPCQAFEAAEEAQE